MINGHFDFSSTSQSSPQNSNSSCGDHDFRVEPIVSKRIDSANATMAGNEDHNATMLTTCLMKRPTEALESAIEGSEKSKKRKKKDHEVSVTNEEEGRGRELVIALSLDMSEKWFPRIWEEHDEIVILEGMIEFIQNGGDPFVDAVGFLETIKESLHFSPTVKHLKTQMRKMKTKYEKMANRAREGQEDTVIVKTHELKCYGLSKQIWGASKDDGKSVAIGIGTKKKKEKKFESRNEMGVEVNRKLSPKALNLPLSIFSSVGDLMGLDLNSFVAQSGPRERVSKGESDSIENSKLKVEDAKAYLKWIDFLREKAMETQEKLESSDSLRLFEV